MDAREYLASLGRLRWERMTEQEKVAHIRKMVAGQRRKKLHKRAKGKAALARLAKRQSEQEILGSTRKEAFRNYAMSALIEPVGMDKPKRAKGDK